MATSDNGTIFTPELLTALQQISNVPERNAILQQQMAQANALKQPMPEGKMVGRVYAAPNPLQDLNSAVSQGLAGYGQGKSLGAQSALADSLGPSRGLYQQALLKLLYSGMGGTGAPAGATAPNQNAVMGSPQEQPGAGVQA